MPDKEARYKRNYIILPHTGDNAAGGHAHMTKVVDCNQPGVSSACIPAEWEPHAATWLAWPKNPTDWPGKLVPVQWAYAEMARHLASSELVRIIVQDAMQARRVRETLRRAHADLERIECVILPYDRSWTRDTLPFFVRVGALRAIEVRHFRFNGWAKYRDYTRDTLLPPRIARRLRMHCVPVQRHGRHVVLEGGAIDTNGAGTLLTTEECLLDAVTQPRNPGLSRGDLERCWREHLGIRRTIWLNRGIAGDDTHGHVDDICRFVNRTTVVLAHEDNPRDINYRALHDNAERLQSARTADGQRIRVVRLPMPAPLFYNRHRLPASYANFYIANRVVLVPTFNDPRDRVALGILSELFPRRSVIGIHAVDLVWGFGSVHCLTHEQPA